ncbi:alkaline phosphatase D family protein [Zhouia amylolytica]|uniref:alkaline phosphatase D family protein n=1 Tax=Zhouia amylolytica TaxID=376730 RepID=UPI0020CFE7C5|nr:alkaline phosphatase D family protein [Zhouia amylolytica]MCQ0110496.1 alkaline phosphatase D family protein [Zhouia amylolytica]
MDRRKCVKTIVLGSVLPMVSPGVLKAMSVNDMFKPASVDFESEWHLWGDMSWAGPEYWGNRLQDWEINNGKLVCNVNGRNRNLHLLTIQKQKKAIDFRVSLEVEPKKENLQGDYCLGIRLGAKGEFEDYRSAAVFGKGVDVGLNQDAKLVVGDSVFETTLTEVPELYKLEVFAEAYNDNRYNLSVAVIDPESGAQLTGVSNQLVDAESLEGNFAILADCNQKRVADVPSAAFAEFKIKSSELHVKEDQVFGPICFAQYTLHQNKLKLTAQCAPFERINRHKLSLQFNVNGKWEEFDSVALNPDSRAVNFTVEDWKYNEDVPYRLVAEIPLENETRNYQYNGTISKEPIEKEEVSAAVFSCNFHFGFPDNDIYSNVSKLNPDIILFLGDQFYEGTGGFGADYVGSYDKRCLDYLRKWYMFGWSYREIFRHKPCAIIPDDHDVYHGNVWGEGGKKADVSNGYGMTAQDSGGYKMTADWVNMVQFTQTSHLPDPYDATPVKQNIGVYYTSWNYAGLSFAILEDRKFKSAPKNVLPEEAQVRNGWIQNRDFDIKKYKNIEASLLGERQHDFLKDWVEDWKDAEMKVVLSQTNFATVATLPEDAIDDSVVPSMYIPQKGEYVSGDKPTFDMDSNGWPQKQRDEALEIIRKAHAFHIAGDQHLSTFVKYGVDEYGDSGYAFAGPALNNIWPRRFWPPVDAANHTYEDPAYTGDHIDGFGNKITVKAVGNPFQTGKTPKRIHDRATGYGLVTFNKNKRTIKTECWPRYVDVAVNRDQQFAGWPIEVTQEDNFGKKAVAWLPEINVENANKPLLKIYNESDVLVYALRLKENSFKPKVFAEGKYKIVVEETATGVEKVLDKVKAKEKQRKSITLKF